MTTVLGGCFFSFERNRSLCLLHFKDQLKYWMIESLKGHVIVVNNLYFFSSNAYYYRLE